MEEPHRPHLRLGATTLHLQPPPEQRPFEFTGRQILYILYANFFFPLLLLLSSCHAVNAHTSTTLSARAPAFRACAVHHDHHLGADRPPWPLLNQCDREAR